MSRIYSNLHINGQLIYNNNPQEGYVLTTNSDGLVSWTSSVSILPTASNTDFGYMKIGQSLNINESGFVDIATASSGVIGGIMLGQSLSINESGSVDIATASVQNIGGVMIGNGLTVSNIGVLSVSGGGSGTAYTSGIGLTLSGSTFSLSTPNYKVIYVSATGSDSNNGLSPLTPVLNLWKGRDLATYGDTVMVMPGNYIFDNRNAVGCPYNGLIESKVNLWKDGVSYNFMPGAKIYSYGSTSGSYSPYSDNMIFFQPNSLTYSECYVLGYLEIYGTSEGADNSGGGTYLFIGEENLGTWPGFKFDLQAKIVDGGGTLIRSVRQAATASACYVNVDIHTVKYSYTTGQSSNSCWSTWRGAETAEMLINIKIKNLFAAGTSDFPVFQIMPNATKATSNYLKVNIQVDYADFTQKSYLVLYSQRSANLYNTAGYPGTNVSSGYINLHIEECIFSPSLIRALQAFSNYYINITGNYYDSGTITSSYVYSTYVGGTNTFGNGPFLLLPDVGNDATGDYPIVNFTGNLYMKNPTRHVAYMGMLPNVGTVYHYFGLNNMKLNFRGDIHFNVLSDYTGTLFFVGMGKLVYNGNINGVNQYLGGTYSFSVYGTNGYAGNEMGPGFAGSIIGFGSYKAYATLQNTNILTSTNKQSLLLAPATYQSAYGDPTLNIYNSNIKLYATSSVLADGSYLNCFVENSTIRNYGTKEVFYNPVSTGNIQLLNSTIISNGTYSTINYPFSTINSGGVYSNKDIAFGTLNGTVSVLSFIV